MRRSLRSRIIRIGVVVVAVVIAIVLVLLVFGVLVFPSSSASHKVELTGVHWKIVEGTTASGLGWFGPSEFNYTAVDGYPINVSVGGTIAIPWSFSSYDVVNHTIIGVVVGPPFAFVTSSPALPVVVPGGTDDAFLSVTVRAPSTGGLVLGLNLTVYSH